MTDTPKPANHDEDAPVVAMGGISTRYAHTQAERYEQTLRKLVAAIHRMADHVAREGEARIVSVTGDDGVADYNWAAQQVVHAIAWDTANLNLNGFLSAAMDAHNAVRGRVK